MGSPAEDLATLVSVQHFCLHDGPGTRSVVFFKGCPLRCAWCSNPESWTRAPQLAHKAHVCVGCRRCVEACPRGLMLEPGRWDHERCDGCGVCVEACPASALVQLGERTSLEALLARLRPEFHLYRQSGGGVTLSGGEVTLQAPFAAALARTLRDEGIHVAIETCGLYQPEGPAVELLVNVDLVLYDIKLFDEAEHRRWCGAGNRQIKANLGALQAAAHAGQGPRVWPRMPVIPGLSTRMDNVHAWARWLVERDFEQLTLVPYHAYGAGKRAWLGSVVPPAPELPALEPSTLAAVRGAFEAAGLRVYAPGEEPPPPPFIPR